MTEDDVRKLLKTEGLLDIERVVMRFAAVYPGGPDGSRTVTIEIRDGGQDAIPNYRYTVHVQDENGSAIGGNGGPTIEQALMGTHWTELERSED